MTEPRARSDLDLAALDVGTNSFHLVVARRVAGDRFETVTREREMVRLGHGGGDMKELSPAAIDRGVVLPPADAPHLRQLRRHASRRRHQRSARGRELSRLPRPSTRRGGDRHRGDLGCRRGPPDPPRRAADSAGVRSAHAPRGRRRGFHRAAPGPEGRDVGRPQLQARRRPAHRPVLPGRRHRWRRRDGLWPPHPGDPEPLRAGRRRPRVRGRRRVIRHRRVGCSHDSRGNRRRTAAHVQLRSLHSR